MTNALASLAKLGVIPALLQTLGSIPVVTAGVATALVALTAALGMAAVRVGTQTYTSMAGGASLQAASMGAMSGMGKIYWKAGALPEPLRALVWVPMSISTRRVKRRRKRKSWGRGAGWRRECQSRGLSPEGRPQALPTAWDSIAEGTSTFADSKKKLIEVLGAAKVAELEQLGTLREQTEEVRKQLSCEKAILVQKRRMLFFFGRLWLSNPGSLPTLPWRRHLPYEVKWIGSTTGFKPQDGAVSILGDAGGKPQPTLFQSVLETMVANGKLGARPATAQDRYKIGLERSLQVPINHG
ncbi:MAG: hypothetical protein MZW92_31480 [Comamonadaceae bacterium]|nr:hypothetical protein [Comamonadaceae bacterium]